MKGIAILLKVLFRLWTAKERKKDKQVSASWEDQWRADREQWWAERNRVS